MLYPVFDAHSDTAHILWMKGRHLENDTCHVSLRRAEALGQYAQVFSFCTTAWRKTVPPEEQYRLSKAYFVRELAENTDRIALCGSAADIRRAWQEGKTAAVLGIEGAEAIGCDPGRLEEAAEEGVRIVTLTWNGENPLGGSHLTGGGLTAQGREFVRRAQSLGMVIDLSHASDEVFFDVCEIAQAPVIASHSDSRALCGMSRNLTDEMFRCLAELHGFAGLNLYGSFLDESGVSSVDALVRHAEHFWELGGDGFLGMGGDWDGIDALPQGMTGVDGIAGLASAFDGRGIPPKTQERFFAGALLRVLDDCGAKSLKSE